MKTVCLTAALVPFLVLATFSTSVASASEVETEKTFRLVKPVTLHPAAVTTNPQLAGRRLDLFEDTILTVLETTVDERGGTLLHLGIDSDATPVSDVWVQANELDEKALEEVSSLDENESGGEVGGDSMSTLGQGMTYCYKFVKMYLMKIGLTNHYLAGGSAWMAKNALPAAGFALNGRSPTAAHVNDVCVYYGGRGGNGHVEVKTAAGWYYGYGYKPQPITLRNHRLIGCYSKRQ